MGVRKALVVHRDITDEGNTVEPSGVVATWRFACATYMWTIQYTVDSVNIIKVASSDFNVHLLFHTDCMIPPTSICVLLEPNAFVVIQSKGKARHAMLTKAMSLTLNNWQRTHNTLE
jgi:hypothetical protein